ncbi:GTP-binding protein A-like [Clarias gariepinus]
MVGETGTGKTTLINAMVNYILGVKFTDEVWFEITEEGGDNPISDQSKSQTTKITVYDLFVQDNQFSLTIIDTPGYGDTRGSEYDRQIANNLYKLFHSDSGVKEIDAVCLVVKASQNRLTDRQQYIFDALLSLFGKDIENNIVIMVTHSDGIPPEDALNAIKKAGIASRRDEENQPDYF